MRLPVSRALLASVLLTVSFALLTTAARAADGSLQIVPIGLGNVHVNKVPEQQQNSDAQDCNHGDGTDQDFASNRGDVSGECTLTYPVGTAVTLTAAGSAEPAPTARRATSTIQRPPSGAGATTGAGTRHRAR